MKRRRPGIQTRAVHAGEPRPPVGGAITMPIFQSSTYVLEGDEDFDDIRYIRLNNTPNQQALHAKLASLEGTEAAVVTSSGTSAVSISLLSCLDSGDHLIAQDRIYGGTRKILDAFAERYRIDVSYVAADAPERWEAALRPETKAFYVESLTNPLLEIGALDEAARFARAHGLVSMIDNTFATPINFQPARMGYDLVIHSASKYLNGHSDVVAGAVAGSNERILKLRKMLNLMGVCLDPNACFLLQRGLKTLPLRVPAQNANAQALAEALDAHPKVRTVCYPGLPSDPGHGRASEWFKAAGAMVTFAPEGGRDVAERLLKRLRMGQIAPSLGGLETLVCRPVTTSHAGLPAELRLTMGVTDDLIRVSAGVEDADDIIADILQALEESI